MATETARWVHGTIVEVEFSEYVDRVVRRGWGTHFFRERPAPLSPVEAPPWWGHAKEIGEVTNWFHFPFTTPIGLLLGVEKVFVLYSTVHTVPADPALAPTVTNVHLYDGPNKIKAFDGLSLSGDHRQGVDAANSWSVKPALGIHFGLGISVGVRFPALEEAKDTSVSEISFAAAGVQVRKLKFEL